MRRRGQGMVFVGWVEVGASGAAAAGGGGLVYSMTPEQLKEAEAREAARLAEER